MAIFHCYVSSPEGTHQKWSEMVGSHFPTRARKVIHVKSCGRDHQSPACNVSLSDSNYKEKLAARRTQETLLGIPGSISLGASQKNPFIPLPSLGRFFYGQYGSSFANPKVTNVHQFFLGPKGPKIP